VRNGSRAKTVLTESTGQVGIEVPRDRDGTFEPQIVRKRQRRLTRVDEMVGSLYAKGADHRGDLGALRGDLRRLGIEGDRYPSPPGSAGAAGVGPSVCAAARRHQGARGPVSLDPAASRQGSASSGRSPRATAAAFASVAWARAARSVGTAS